MKYLKLFESFNEVHEICQKYDIENYTINTDGSIDVDDNVDIYNRRLIKLPLKFNKINGYFYCCYNKLTSLEGSPVEVNGYFSCYNNNLTSLEGSPVEVNGSFYCDYNELTSFEFAPKRIRGEFNCENNNIKTFEYFPNFVKYGFYCIGNPIWEVWKLFENTTKIELFNDFDIIRDEDTNTPSIVLNRLNDFLLTIGKRNKRGYSYVKATELLKSYKII